jgi:nitrous oxidase accessory protein
MRRIAWGVSLFILVLIFTASAGAQDSERLIVSPGGAYSSIPAALAAAQDGDIIEVWRGTYAKPFVVDKSVSLIGVDNPVIDGGGVGDIVTITAPDVTIQGFIVRNTGSSMTGEDTAIIAQAPRAIITENRLENVLYGIYLDNAPGSIVRHNIVYSQDVEETLRGDGIRAWYSDDIQIIANEVYGGRDLILNYTDNAIIQDNLIQGGRYGLHFMYSNGVRVEGNQFKENSVGVFLMYSKEITIHQNIFAYSGGSSGYGLALKDMDYVTVTENMMVGNQVGIYLDNSPSLYEGTNTISGNVLAYNNIGVTTLPSVERNIFTANSFIENLQQTSIRGREITSRNIWHQDGQGNYWSDYVGYDRNGDGIGETTYQADKLFDRLTDRYPQLQLLRYSPAAQAVEFTAAAFPLLRPQAALVDEAPMMHYRLPSTIHAHARKPSATFLGFSLAVVVGTLGAGLKILRSSPILSQAAHQPINETEGNMILVENLVKKYGKIPVLDGLTFSVRAGESIALWGSNGAGKTTTLKCLLGLLPFTGQLNVNGIDVRRDAKAVRAAVGYVPQEVAFYDLTVKETMRFYARLKKVGAERIEEVLSLVDLMGQDSKAVAALSGGMKQRLALAISLLSDPPILLLDEPTANLDAQSQLDFLQLVHTLNQAGKTIIFSSHRVDEVRFLAGRVLILEAGRVNSECTPEQFVKRMGAQRWLKIWVEPNRHEDALTLLDASGYKAIMNSNAFYVEVNALGKMQPIRILEAAEIPVRDFDILTDRPQSHKEQKTT